MVVASYFFFSLIWLRIHFLSEHNQGQQIDSVVKLSTHPLQSKMHHFSAHQKVSPSFTLVHIVCYAQACVCMLMGTHLCSPGCNNAAPFGWGGDRVLPFFSVGL